MTIKVLRIELLPDSEIQNAGKKFFFGLENRRKLVFEKNMLKDFKTGEILFHFKNSHVRVIPSSFMVEITEKNEVKHIISETQDGVFVDDEIVSGTEKMIDIPSFQKYEYSFLMKTIYHEIMFSIIDGVPYARLYDYPKRLVWYRDIAYVGLFLEFINRTDLIENFINSINKMYDGSSHLFWNDRAVTEPDNLGQVLYLQSLVKSPNRSLIHDIIVEARRICDKNGNLIGTTDGEPSSAYQNGWIIFGLKRLGLEEIANEFNPHSSIDRNLYSQFLWFTSDEKNIHWHEARKEPFNISLPSEQIKVGRKKPNSSSFTNVKGQNFPYTNVARLHFNMLSGKEYLNPILTQIEYPITWGDFTRPHIWHAVELYMYLKEILCKSDQNYYNKTNHAFYGEMDEL